MTEHNPEKYDAQAMIDAYNSAPSCTHGARTIETVREDDLPRLVHAYIAKKAISSIDDVLASVKNTEVTQVATEGLEDDEQ